VAGATPTEVGTSHGSQLSERIHATIDFYFQLFERLGLSMQQIELVAEQFAAVLQQFAGGVYAEEIEAIACAASVQPWKVFALNARTEIVNSAPAAAALHPTECTTVSLPAFNLLAQNWDWAADLQQLLVLMRIKRSSGPGVLMICEPGIIGKIGLNDHGVGVCLNLLNKAGYGKSAAPPGVGQWPAGVAGVPIHVLLRCVLDSATLDEAVTAVCSAPRGWGSMSLITAAAPGASMSIEIDGSREEVVRSVAAPVFRTNHYVGAAAQARRVPPRPAAPSDLGAPLPCASCLGTQPPSLR